MQLFGRTSRIAAGLVLAGGAIELARNAIHYSHDRHDAIPAWHIIVGTWAVALAIGIVGSLIPDRGDRGRVASYVLPCFGAALMMPLTLHLVVFRAMRGIDGFDDWVLYSLIFVGIAHVVFAALVGARAVEIVEGRDPTTVSSIFVITLTASAVPGAIVVLPLPIVAATMVPMLPLLHAMKHFGKAPALPTAVAKVAS